MAIAASEQSNEMKMTTFFGALLTSEHQCGKHRLM